MKPHTPERDIKLPRAELKKLMPMYIHLNAQGEVVDYGTTLAKVLGDILPKNISFFDFFKVRRPTGVETVSELRTRAGERLFLVALNDVTTEMRGLAVIDDDDGVLLNLSFGINVVEAVRTHDLTDTDFAPTDLAIELLYLVEAKDLIFDEFRRLNSRLEGARSIAVEQALTDTLTGLRNRRALDFALANACRLKQPFALLHLDLDHFKQINDNLGHAAGDHALRIATAILRDETRAGDTVARIGGDEFVILMPQLTDEKELIAVSKRVLERLQQTIHYNGETCHIGASIGLVVSANYRSPTPETMLSDADKALYAAKHAGRGRAVLSNSSP